MYTISENSVYSTSGDLFNNASSILSGTWPTDPNTSGATWLIGDKTGDPNRALGYFAPSTVKVFDYNGSNWNIIFEKTSQISSYGNDADLSGNLFTVGVPGFRNNTGKIESWYLENEVSGYTNNTPYNGWNMLLPENGITWPLESLIPLRDFDNSQDSTQVVGDSNWINKGYGTYGYLGIMVGTKYRVSTSDGTQSGTYLDPAVSISTGSVSIRIQRLIPSDFFNTVGIVIDIGGIQYSCRHVCGGGGVYRLGVTKNGVTQWSVATSPTVNFLGKITWDGTDVRCYVDGIERFTESNSGVSNLIAPTDVNPNLNLGDIVADFSEFAVRDAAQGGDYVYRVKRAMGSKVSILSGDQIITAPEGSTTRINAGDNFTGLSGDSGVVGDSNWDVRWDTSETSPTTIFREISSEKLKLGVKNVNGVYSNTNIITFDTPIAGEFYATWSYDTLNIAEQSNGDFYFNTSLGNWTRNYFFRRSQGGLDKDIGYALPSTVTSAFVPGNSYDLKLTRDLSNNVKFYVNDVLQSNYVDTNELESFGFYCYYSTGGSVLDNYMLVSNLVISDLADGTGTPIPLIVPSSYNYETLYEYDLLYKGHLQLKRFTSTDKVKMVETNHDVKILEINGTNRYSIYDPIRNATIGLIYPSEDFLQNNASGNPKLNQNIPEDVKLQAPDGALNQVIQVDNAAICFKNETISSPKYYSFLSGDYVELPNEAVIYNPPSADISGNLIFNEDYLNSLSAPRVGLSGLDYAYFGEMPINDIYYDFDIGELYVDMFNMHNEYDYKYDTDADVTDIASTYDLVNLRNTRDYERLGVNENTLWVSYRIGQNYQGSAPYGSLVESGENTVEMSKTVETSGGAFDYTYIEKMKGTNRIRQSAHKSNIYSIEITNSNLNENITDLDERSYIQSIVERAILQFQDKVAPIHTQLWKIVWKGQ